MNFRNRKLVIAIRILFGILLVFSGLGGLLSGQSTEGVPPELIPVMQMLWKSGLFQMIKVTELVSGLMLVFGFLPALAAIFVAPIGVGVIIFNASLAPSFVPAGVLVCLFDAYLGYAYWDKYKALFARK